MALITSTVRKKLSRFLIAASALAVIVGVGLMAGDVARDYIEIEGILGTASAETTATASGIPGGSAEATAPASQFLTGDTDGGSDDATDSARPNTQDDRDSGGSPSAPDLSPADHGQAPSNLELEPRVATAADAFITQAVLSAGSFDQWMSTDTTVTLTSPSTIIFPGVVTLWRWGNGDEYLYDQPIPVSTEGSHGILFRSLTDMLSEPAQSRTIKIDKTPPQWATQPIIAFRNPTTHGFTVGFTRAEDALSGVQYYRILTEGISDFGMSPSVLTSTETTATGNQVDVTGLDTSGGPYFRVTITAVDGAGNERTGDPAYVMVGIARPLLNVQVVDSSQAAAISAGSWITGPGAIRLLASVETSAPMISLRYETLAGSLITTNLGIPLSEPFEIQLAGEGSREISVIATDEYGNTSDPYTVNLKVDRTPPTPPQLVRAQQVSGTEHLRVRWGASTDLTSGVSRYMVKIVDADGAVVASRSTRLTAATFADLPTGAYTATVWAVDVAGHESKKRSALGVLRQAAAAPSGGTSAGGAGGGSGDQAPETPLEPADPPAAEAPAQPTQPSSPAAPVVQEQDDSDPWYLQQKYQWVVGLGALAIVALTLYIAGVRRAFREDLADELHQNFQATQ